MGEQNDIRLVWFKHLKETGRLHPAMCPGVWSDPLQLGGDYVEYVSMAAFVAAVVQDDQNAQLLGLPAVSGSTDSPASRMHLCDWRDCVFEGEDEEDLPSRASRWSVRVDFLFKDLAKVKASEDDSKAAGKLAQDLLLRQNLPKEDHEAVVWAFCADASAAVEPAGAAVQLRMPRRKAAKDGVYGLLGPADIMEGWKDWDEGGSRMDMGLLPRVGWDREHEQEHFDLVCDLVVDRFLDVGVPSETQKREKERRAKLATRWTNWSKQSASKTKSSKKRAADPDDPGDGGAGGSAGSHKRRKMGAGETVAVKPQGGSANWRETNREEHLKMYCLCKLSSCRTERGLATDQQPRTQLARANASQEACTCAL